MSRLLALAACALFLAPASEARGRHAPPLFPDLQRSSIQVVTATGRHRFNVWVAADAASRERGLMHVRRIPPGHGMLFVLEEPRFTAVWMKDTYVSLDVIFIDADGKVVNVAPAATPLSLDPIPSAGPVKAILEVVAGTAGRVRLRAGDRVIHPAFARGN